MTTLEDVYVIFKKYLHIPDTRIIDLILAVALTIKIKGTKIWIIIVGPSGDTKTALVSSLEGIGILRVIKLDQLTRNTLASGAIDKKTGKPVEDLGSRINHDDVMFLIPDLASLISKRSDEKNEIWGQLRNLYDGFISKDTGTGVTRKYNDCNVTLLACATEKIRSETLIHNQLGTRELLYNTDGIEIEEKVKKAWENENLEIVMKKELRASVREFLSSNKYKNMPDNDIPSEMKDFIIKSSKRLSVLRATAEFDRNMELISDVCEETPTRCAKQFKRFYKALKSLDPNYPDKRAKEIIYRLVDSSGDPIMKKVMDFLKTHRSPHYVQEICDAIKLHRRAVKPRLDMLWNMGYVNREHIDNHLKYYWI
jgi:hypothetical protein